MPLEHAGPPGEIINQRQSQDPWQYEEADGTVAGQTGDYDPLDRAGL